MIKITTLGKIKIQKFIEDFKEIRSCMIQDEETNCCMAVPSEADIVSEIQSHTDAQGEYSEVWNCTDNSDLVLRLHSGKDFSFA